MLSSACSEKEKEKGQLHKVFEPSFDAKAVFTFEFLMQKLDYIHYNPVKGKWNLIDDFANYLHSSAGFYEFERIHPHVDIIDYRTYWY
ncbi:MAG: hypothetical protein V4619_11350 [Bacteroidota bacterium]